MSEPSPTGAAPGWPGIPPTWTSALKTGVGAALGGESRVWFTLSHGILNEIYYPRIDRACTRDVGLIVTDGSTFFSEEKRHTTCEITRPAPGIPAYSLVNTCREGRYRIDKDVVADPRRDVILQRVRFTALDGPAARYRVHALLAPHLGNRGYGNTALLGDYKGHPVLCAERDGLALALVSSAPWRGRSAGFVGVSDGWQDLSQHGRMTWFHERADDGNVALTGEIGLAPGGGDVVLALGFGRTWHEAAQVALLSLRDGFAAAWDVYVSEWQAWHHTLSSAVCSADALAASSACVLRVHEDKQAAGGVIAALAVPWGTIRGDDDLGGYHLVWPRDLVEAAGGLAAAGAAADVGRVLDFLAVTQEADGHWPQNMWLDGDPSWNGVQMDETALPILLVDLVRRKGLVGPDLVAGLWPMVRRAAGFLVRNGPVTAQDRWEEDAGYSPFTLAAEIAALLAAADLAEIADDALLAVVLRETADAWNASVERWTYVSDTDLSRQYGVPGYYVRIAPPERPDAPSAAGSYVPIKNRPSGDDMEAAEQIVSADALALVRFGLRSADDPRILSTVAVIDALLKVETPLGPCWHRYNKDGYGEHEDGAPFDGTGVGRAWPLLTGERAHYELLAGRPREAERLALAMARFASEGGLLPEQIWDREDIAPSELYFGRPSGSATPLVWAHAEYVKLRRSLADGAAFDLPPQPVDRYQRRHTTARAVLWRFDARCADIPEGADLRIDLLQPAVVRWTDDHWKTATDTATHDTGLGLHVADLPTADLPRDAVVVFTVQWLDDGRWEGRNEQVRIVAPA